MYRMPAAPSHAEADRPVLTVADRVNIPGKLAAGLSAIRPHAAATISAHGVVVKT
jgi:hypothetical protein